jgi:hypothetical protein
MNKTTARPNQLDHAETPSLLRLLHRWFRARANPLYLLIYLAVIVGITVYGDPNPNQINDDIANTLFALLFFVGPFSDAYMYKDRRRNRYLAFWSPFTIGFSGLAAQYLTSEQRQPHETSHFSLTPFKLRNRINKAYSAFHGDPKALELVKKVKLFEKEQKRISKEQQLQNKRTQKTKKVDEKAARNREKAQAKLDKKNAIRSKRIEASRQHMDAIHLFNRWLRGQRNPIYGILNIALIYFLVQQRGWELAGYATLYIIVVLPLQLTSDGQMSDMRNFKRDSLQFGSFFTLGFAGVIAQYVTRDGSIPHQKSLSNPITLFTSLIDKERRAAIEAIRLEKRVIKKQNQRTLNEIVNFFNGIPGTHNNLSYEKLNQLCKTELFKERNSPEWDSFWMGPLGKQIHGKEIRFFLKILKDEYKPVKFGTEFSVKDSLKNNNFEILKKNYDRVPLVAKQLTDEYEQKLAAKHAQKLQQEKRDKEVRQAIQRNELPELRIRTRNLPIPRAPQNAWDFENICRDWLEAWGETNATVTQQSADGGVDVVSDHCVAQVKFYANGKVGRPELQQLAGAAIPFGDGHLLFFAYNGYTDQAITYAEEISMCLFDFNAHTMRFDQQNSHAIDLVKQLAQLHIP